MKLTITTLIFATMTDNTDTYDFVTFDKEITNGEPPYPVIEINRKGLANFLNDDQGYDQVYQCTVTT